MTRMSIIDAEKGGARQMIGIPKVTGEADIPADMSQEDRNVVLVALALNDDSGFRDTPEEISERTQLSLEVVQDVLNKLKDDGLVKESKVYDYQHDVRPERLRKGSLAAKIAKALGE